MSRADVDLLQSRLDEASTRVQVVVGKLLLNLPDREPIGHQLIGIHTYLIFARGSTETDHVDHVGNGLELLLKNPIFQRLKLH